MPQPKRSAEITPFRPVLTEEFVSHYGKETNPPVVMTIRAGLTHGEIEPIRLWYRSLGIDPDLEPDEDDTSPEANKERSRLAHERIKRAENRFAWPLVSPFVLGWAVERQVDGEWVACPPPAEGGPEMFAHVPSGVFADVLYHFLGIPQRRVEAARKVSSASAPGDAPSPDDSSPASTDETTE